ncbi:MAG TPA: hypothetical protein VGT07_03825 [Steroidobacteraceae bacterium]|nr:hypothetical protein [Steroidobacteraceae bacterium]
MLSKPTLFAVLSGFVLVTCGATAAAAPLTPEQEVHSLVGTYQCVNRESTGHTWRFTSVNDVFGAWLRVHVTYPPQKGMAGDTGIVFVGYDRSDKRWNIISMDADGSYYTRSSHSEHFDGSRWEDDYPRDGAKAVIRTPGPTRYTFDLTLPAKKGPAIESHVVCTRT